jgi:hypothetical protein
MLIYTFTEKRILNGARLYLAQQRFRFVDLCGSSLAVWFPALAARDIFEDFILHQLAKGRETEMGIRVLQDGDWLPLPRPAYVDYDLFHRLSVPVAPSGEEEAAA